MQSMSPRSGEAKMFIIYNLSMPHFHFCTSLDIGAILALPEHVAHHIQVLRLAIGSLSLYLMATAASSPPASPLLKKRICVEIQTFSRREVELPYAIKLAQAMPEASKLDWIIEKAVELGAAGI